MMISVMPLLAGAALVASRLMSSLSSKNSVAYGLANSIVQQASPWPRGTVHPIPDPCHPIEASV